MKTVINFFGAPGSHKSTNAATLFGDMKRNKYDVELIQEYPKKLTWQERHNCLQNQVSIFGRQYELMCIPQTKYIITDSPLVLTLLYNNTHGPTLNKLALECYNSFNNINFLLKLKDYNPKGRNQTFEESLILEQKLINILKSNNIPYFEFLVYDWNFIQKFI